MAQALNRHTITLLAVKLVQPGRLADVVDGVLRILPESLDYGELKKGVRDEIAVLREANLIELYEGQRYVLTKAGDQIAHETGIAHLIDARRMFLLKETRKASQSKRSDTRVRSLLQ